jgi:hypothetical protein
VGLTWAAGLLAAAIAAAVSGAVSYWFNRRALLHRLTAEYDHQQRRELRELIGQYHGPMVYAANSLNYRMWNLYRHADRGWLAVDGQFTPEKYYFASFVYRFLAFFALVRKFEAEAIVLDRRIADETDFLFLNYAAAFNWCMTDTALFDGLEYDAFLEYDHFFADTFRSYCRIPDHPVFPDYQEFLEKYLINPSSRVRPVLQFFDGLARDEDRFRWDRLVVLHLVLLAFINDFGRDTERTSGEKIRSVVEQMQNPVVLRNLGAWLPRHGLHESDGVHAVGKAISDASSTMDGTERILTRDCT